MLERSGQILRITCLVLGALLLIQIVRCVININPLSHLHIPALPTLSVAAETSPTGKGTNSVSAPDRLKNGTNQATRGLVGSNSLGGVSVEKNTNSIGPNQPRQAGRAPNAPAQPARPNSNNVTTQVIRGKIGSNAVSQAEQSAAGTNTLGLLESGKGPTNSGPVSALSTKGTGPGMPPGAMPAGMNPALRPGMGRKPPDLPPAILARVDRVVDSEILGPIMRPLPMALLGIAGEVAFLRSPSGQTGLVKEGEELGPLKLLRIGTNRVLLEHEGQKKELTIFSGLGSESLLEQEHPK